jgi:hypothetical protein
VVALLAEGGGTGPVVKAAGCERNRTPTRPNEKECSATSVGCFRAFEPFSGVGTPLGKVQEKKS